MGNWDLASRVYSSSPRACKVRRDGRETPLLMPRPYLESARTCPDCRTSCQRPFPEKLPYSRPIGMSDQAPSAPFPSCPYLSGPLPHCRKLSRVLCTVPSVSGFHIFTRSDNTDAEIVVLWERAAAQRTPGASSFFQGVGRVGGKAMWPCGQ